MRDRIRFMIALLLIALMSLNILGDSTIFAAASNSSSKTKSAAVPETKVDLSPKYDKSLGLYGYVNKSGKWVIEPRFLNAKEFCEGLAAVVEDSEMSKWGYIKADGTFAIKPKFKKAYNFKNNFAVVSEELFAATINKKGEYIKKTNYYLDGADMNDYCRANLANIDTAMNSENAKYGLIMNDGTIVKPEFDGRAYMVESFLCVFKNGASKSSDDRANFIVLKNGKVVGFEGTITYVTEGIGLIEYTGKTGALKGQRLYQFITSEGKLLKTYKGKDGKEYPFQNAETFSEGYAAVMINSAMTTNTNYNLWGFLKKDGTWLKEPEYVRARSFKNGVAPVKYRGMSYFYVKTDLTPFIPMQNMGEVLKSEAAACTAEVNKILPTLINSSMSEYEKVKVIYKFVTDTVDYDYSAYDNIPRSSYYAYGALKNRYAVCEGFSQLLNLMLKQAGIESLVVGGMGNGDQPHAWNLVKIGGNYYHADATWDDFGGTMFFLKSDAFMSGSRVWNKADYPAAPKDYK